MLSFTALDLFSVTGQQSYLTAIFRNILPIILPPPVVLLRPKPDLMSTISTAKVFIHYRLCPNEAAEAFCHLMRQPAHTTASHIGLGLTGIELTG